MRHEPANIRREWRIPDALWERIQPLLPPRKSHPLGAPPLPSVGGSRGFPGLLGTRSGCVRGRAGH